MDNLLPGYRFYPNEEELVSFYLHNKLENRRDDLIHVMDRIIPVLDIYNFNPSDLPHHAGDLCHRDPEQWFFFIPRQDSGPRGGRPRRLTNSGYWKATGSPGCVYSSNLRIIGEKRTMVFYEGRAPIGTKTEWKMNEYKAIQGEAPPSTTTPLKLRQEFSLCRIYKKSKSVSALERRPLAVNRPAAPIQAHHGGVDDQATTASTILRENITTSHDSSSSGDHHHDQNHTQSQTLEAHAAGSSTTGVNAMDDEPVWDWEHFDWDNYDLQ